MTREITASTPNTKVLWKSLTMPLLERDRLAWGNLELSWLEMVVAYETSVFFLRKGISSYIKEEEPALAFLEYIQ